MGRANRDKMKRQLVASHNNLERSYTGIMFLHNLFEEVHPELAAGLEISTKLIYQAQEVLEAFAKQAWNLDKGQYESYRSK